MHQYTLIDPVTGEQSILPEVELIRNLRQNCVLLQGREHIGIITHRDLVAFARWCAGEMLTLLVDEPDQRSIHALTMVDRWLEDQQSVTPEELEAAAGAAEAAAADAADVAWAAWAAADATWAADAAWAARSAARAAWAVEAASYETQAKWLVEHLQSGK